MRNAIQRKRESRSRLDKSSAPFCAIRNWRRVSSRASVVPEWEPLVGKQIAAVTKPISVTADGTLFIAVKTNAWMTELSLMEPQILRALNAKTGRTRVRKIRLQLMR